MEDTMRSAEIIHVSSGEPKADRYRMKAKQCRAAGGAAVRPAGARPPAESSPTMWDELADTADFQQEFRASPRWLAHARAAPGAAELRRGRTEIRRGVDHREGDAADTAAAQGGELVGDAVRRADERIAADRARGK